MNKKDIKWSNDKTVSMNVVKEIEELWNVEFPKQYIDIVLRHDDSIPLVKNEKGEWKPGLVKIPNWSSEAMSFGLLSYLNSSDIKNKRIVFVHNAYKDSLLEPDKVFPFADDGAGNILFFDYRKDNNEPTIMFMDHEVVITESELTEEELEEKSVSEWLEGNLYPVCKSFSELMDSLYPRNY